MTLQEAINSRFSVRNYNDAPLTAEAINALNRKIDECNTAGNLHIQLVTNEPKAFSGIMSYGKFSGVRNYLVMAGTPSEDLDYNIGYYGEQLVLLAQQSGLGTCWVGLTYKKVNDAFALAPGEKVKCVIAIGCHNETYRRHKSKAPADVSNISAQTPSWFADGVDAALKAPTAINQQKFFFEYIDNPSGKPFVYAKRKFSIAGYTKMDLGIACLHFEIGAGRENFEWKNK